MKIIKPSVIIESINGEIILKNIEKAGRTCYQSNPKNSIDFIRMIIKRGHESVLEHEKITARIICDRGVTHELVRHRIASYSQESTRYVNYKEGLTVIKPCFWNEKNNEERWLYNCWLGAMNEAEYNYKQLIEMGATPQEARSVLPNSLKTEIVVTMNFREWRHFLKLRCNKTSHPQMREIAFMLLDKMYDILPVIFGDIYKEYEQEKSNFNRGRI